MGPPGVLGEFSGLAWGGAREGGPRIMDILGVEGVEWGWFSEGLDIGAEKCQYSDMVNVCSV